jgi:hypothetical protein
MAPASSNHQARDARLRLRLFDDAAELTASAQSDSDDTTTRFLRGRNSAKIAATATGAKPRNIQGHTKVMLYLYGFRRCL